VADMSMNSYHRPPFARIDFKPGTVLLDQPYDISLELKVPLSDANVQLGMTFVIEHSCDSCCLYRQFYGPAGSENSTK